MSKPAKSAAYKALELDPEYAVAMVQLGWLEWEAAGSGWREFPDESREKAREWANRALELDSSVSDAYSLLSIIELGEENHEQAIALGRQAVGLNPSSTDALAMLSPYQRAIPIRQIWHY